MLQSVKVNLRLSIIMISLIGLKLTPKNDSETISCFLWVIVSNFQVINYYDVFNRTEVDLYKWKGNNYLDRMNFICYEVANW